MRWTVIALISCVFSGGPARAEDVPQLATAEPRPVANAATVYWQAFAALPTLSPQEQKRFDATKAAPAEPLAADMAPLIERFDPALKLMRRASEAKTCDWDLDYSQGPLLLLPHLAKARELGFAALLRAKLRFAGHDTARATDDMLTTLKMARQVASSQVLISMLVGVSIEAPAIDLLASYLPQLDRPTLQRLAGELAALPATPSVAECLSVEGAYFVRWLELFSQADPAHGKQALVGSELVRKLNSTLDIASSDEDGRQLAESVDTAKKLQAALVRLRKDYAEMARIAALDSYAARYEQMKQFDDEVAKSKANLRTLDADRVLSLLAVPAIRRVVDREMKRDVRRELLRLAVQALLDGKSTLGPAHKLSGGVPELKFTSSGFELRYRMAPTGDWEVLTVGQPTK